jgi:hypothetical protein
MRRNFSTLTAGAIVSFSFAAASVATHPGAAHAQIAGEWTRCIAWLSNGTQILPVNGQANYTACYQAALRCAAGRPLQLSKYWSSPVIANAPYERCTAFP